MNVIGSRPDGWWRDRPGAMRRLVEALERFAATTGDQVTVVFDGSGFPLETGVEVRFAAGGGPNAADRGIVELLRSDREAAAASTVVTSDRALADAARATGAQVVGSADFRRRLDGA